jgi:hypothetical protein
MISRFFISKRPPQQPGEKFIGLVKKKFKKPRFAETSTSFTPMRVHLTTDANDGTPDANESFLFDSANYLYIVWDYDRKFFFNYIRSDSNSILVIR